MEGVLITQYSIQYSIQSDIASGQMQDDKLHWQMQQQFSDIYVDFVEDTEDFFTLYFNRNLTTEEASAVASLVNAHVPSEKYGVKILDLVEDESANKSYIAVDYKVQTRTNLFPQRTFVQGELQRVDWHSNEEKTDLVLRTDISYNRDTFGFATDRTTTRTWYDYDDNPMPIQKVTTKLYSLMDTIKEGKTRRGNIVDGVQLPVFGFLQEAANDPTAAASYGLNPATVLLVGREFMDRFEVEFAKFIDNSSSITDLADPNFNRKTVVVEFENAAQSTDPWLNFQPALLGGARILDYLVMEFSV